MKSRLHCVLPNVRVFGPALGWRRLESVGSGSRRRRRTIGPARHAVPPSRRAAGRPAGCVAPLRTAGPGPSRYSFKIDKTQSLSFGRQTLRWVSRSTHCLTANICAPNLNCLQVSTSAQTGKSSWCFTTSDEDSGVYLTLSNGQLNFTDYTETTEWSSVKFSPKEVFFFSLNKKKKKISSYLVKSH